MPDTKITLAFEGKTLGSSAGCSFMGGEYGIRNGVLARDKGVASTGNCSVEEREQDEWLTAFLAAGADVSAGSEILTLSGERGVSIELTERTTEDDPI